MHVLLTATSYPSSDRDWQGLFIRRMLEGLSAQSEVEMSVWLPPGPLPAGIRSLLDGDEAQWLGHLASRGGIAHVLRSSPLRGFWHAAGLLSRLRRVYLRSKADLFHVNWLQNALPLPRDSRPALITALGTDMRWLELPGIVAALRRVMRSRHVALCPNADWMTTRLIEHFGDLARIVVVPFGVDAAWFDVERTAEVQGRQRWLCVTRLTRDKLGPLFAWAEPHFHSHPERELHLFGPRQESGLDIPPWVHFHGPVVPDTLREAWFPSATGLISLSHHAEGRPQVMLEAMAAGLPILASDIPAHRDLLQHGHSGWLCGDIDALGQGLDLIEDASTNRAMGQRAKARARESSGTWSDCGARYARIYTDLLRATPR